MIKTLKRIHKIEDNVACGISLMIMLIPLSLGIWFNDTLRLISFGIMMGMLISYLFSEFNHKNVWEEA